MGTLNWLFVDLNSYFASVEQDLRPELRGKPVGVVPAMVETTSCIAASYEAKAFGIKTGTPVYEARKRCPGINIVEARPEAYFHYHEQIVQAVESCLPVTTVMSIDEMACRLKGSDQHESNAWKLGQAVKSAIFRVGNGTLRCSVGIAPNRFLAKVSSDIQKPDGLTLLRMEDIPKKLYTLKPTDFAGIGPAMQKRLAHFGIYTVEQLYKLTRSEMSNVWGSITGERFYEWLRGVDLEMPESTRKTIGHSHVLPPMERNPEGSYAVAQKLTSKVAERLRRYKLWAKNFSLHISYRDQPSWHQQVRMAECQDTFALVRALKMLWENAPLAYPPMKIAVAVHGLVEDSDHTMGLFGEDKNARLFQVVDKINHRYGGNMLYTGGVHEARSSAPTRIAFTAIPEQEDFDLED